MGSVSITFTSLAEAFVFFRAVFDFVRPGIGHRVKVAVLFGPFLDDFERQLIGFPAAAAAPAADASLRAVTAGRIHFGMMMAVVVAISPASPIMQIAHRLLAARYHAHCSPVQVV